MENITPTEFHNLPDIDSLENDTISAANQFPLLTSGELFEKDDSPEVLIRKILDKDMNNMALRAFINNWPLRFISPMYEQGGYNDQNYLQDFKQAKQDAIKRYWKDESTSFEETLYTHQKTPGGSLRYTWPMYFILFDSYIAMRNKGWPHYSQTDISLVV